MATTQYSIYKQLANPLWNQLDDEADKEVSAIIAHDTELRIDRQVNSVKDFVENNLTRNTL